MRRLLIATANSGKFNDLRNFLSDLSVAIVSLDDLSIEEKIEETGKTYRENSVKKAVFYARKSGLPTIADDGGIEIDALGGEPGVRSRRFLASRSGVLLRKSKDATDEEIIEQVQKLIKNIPEDIRGAKFKTVITFALPNGKSFSATGSVRGILKEPYHKFLKGYPYRSFFYLPKIEKYYHENELSEEEQKLYNHRWKAITKLKPTIKKEMALV